MKKKMLICLAVLALTLTGPSQMKSEGVSKVDSTLGFLVALYEYNAAFPDRISVGGPLEEIQQTNKVDVSIRVDHVLSQSEIFEFETMGIEFHTVNGQVARVGTVYGALVPVTQIWNLADKEGVQFIESAWKPCVYAPLDVSVPEVRATNVWGLTDLLGRPITGRGVTIANFDTGVDVFHPDFWYADGGSYSWVDNGNGIFDSGSDFVDLNGNGLGDPNEVLRFFDAQGTAGNNDGVFQVAADWLYNDGNNDGTRNYGLGAGFGESNATYGELIFLAVDSNGNNLLDLGEILQALGTSKVAHTLNSGGITRSRGIDLIQTSPDTNGHGTGVAGILAGGTIGRQFVGVAPDSTLLCADRINNSDTVYIPWASGAGADIMLYEFGGWVQQFLDGSSNLEQMINTEAASGIVQVVPAGNLAGSNRHCQTVAAMGPTASTFTIPALAPAIQTVYISVLWRTPANNITFTLQSPAASVALPGTTPGWQFAVMADGHTVWFNRVSSSRGTARYDIVIMSTPLTSGAWTLTLNNGGGPENIDGYIADDATSWSGGAAWTSFITDQRTVTWPATADSAITVASYSTRSRLGTVPVGDLSLFSGRGTRLDGTSILDISAPGNYDVITAESKDTGAGLVGKYQWVGGTSAAGPHVAGAAALMLQNKPWLGHNAVEAILQLTARTDGFTGVTPNDSWGYGKLDCLAAVLYNISPTVTVVYPNGGEMVAGSCTLQWTAVDPDGDPLSVDLEYSDDNGATWYVITVGIGNTGTYTWDTRMLAEGDQYLIRITVYDGFGGTAQDQSDATFTVLPAAYGEGSPQQSPVYNKWILNLAENRIKEALALREEAYTYLEKAKKKGVDTQVIEKELKDADLLLEKAQTLLEHNPVPANNLAITVIDLYKDIIENLKTLLEDP
ncbi:MAG: S8 family serine peptidase [Candidatus Methanofastidiosia archaeon]